AVLLALVLAFSAFAEAPSSQQAQALREREAALGPRLQASPFGQPLVIESNEAAGRASGHVYAVMPHAYDVVRAGLKQPAQWCHVLILHLNVKRCESEPGRVAMYLGTKHAQAIEQAYRLQFSHSVPADSDDYLHVRMEAPSGPMGTRDYV